MLCQGQVSILIILSCLTAVAYPFFCHSNCIDYLDACFDITEETCYVCADSIFKDKDYTNPYNKCQPHDQTEIVAQELSSQDMDLSGYTASSAVPYDCTNISLSGAYTANDYISKNFTGITSEHYQMVIRFGVGYLGTWSEADTLQVVIDDGTSELVQNTWGYSCGHMMDGSNVTTDNTQNMCSLSGTDCFKIVEYVIQHNKSYVHLNISALTTETDPDVQSWGVKDLVIAIRKCHHYCDTCYGESPNQCLTCTGGYYLRGNTCVQECPQLALPDSRLCVESCPAKYYHNTLNNYCQSCLEGCSLCSGSTHCLIWDSADANPEDLWTDKLELWIIIILGSLVLIGLLLWKFVLKKYFQKEGEENSNSGDSKSSEENNVSKESMNQLNIVNTQENIVIEEMEGVEPVRVDVRRRKKRKADIEASNNNSELFF